MGKSSGKARRGSLVGMRRARLLGASAALIVAAPAGAHTGGVRTVSVPAAGRAVDTSHPNHLIGRGTPAGCTSAAVIAAVRAGGIIRFNCGPGAVTIRMNATAKVVNTSARVV